MSSEAIYNGGILDFYVGHGSFGADCYDFDRHAFWQKPAQKDQSSCWISDNEINEKYRYLGIRKLLLRKAVVAYWLDYAPPVCHRNAVLLWTRD